MNIGFIGTGVMGKPMAKNILKSGYPLTLYARNQDKVKELINDGAQLVNSPSEVAKKCEVIVLSLPFDPEVKEIITGKNGLLSGAGNDCLIIDTTTGTPQNSIDMASLAASQGVEYIDAPVSGGVQGAIDGTLTFIVGGNEKAIVKATPVLNTMGSNIYRVGDVGTGRTLKALNQIISAMNTLTICETVVLGNKLGVTAEKFYEVLSHCAANSYHLQTKMPNFIIPGKFDIGHRIEMMIKDLEIALQIARDNNVPMYLSSLGTQMYRAGSASGYAKKDISSMVKYLGSIIGV
jgi:3-hydroxyisobutyrate dehydrogenase-like beta-hydroxyacid dehydrogenase